LPDITDVRLSVVYPNSAMFSTKILGYITQTRGNLLIQAVLKKRFTNGGNGMLGCRNRQKKERRGRKREARGRELSTAVQTPVPWPGQVSKGKAASASFNQIRLKGWL